MHWWVWAEYHTVNCNGIPGTASAYSFEELPSQEETKGPTARRVDMALSSLFFILVWVRSTNQPTYKGQCHYPNKAMPSAGVFAMVTRHDVAILTTLV
ncbi:hypothetical protein SKAU_G00036980 [Synaphobranchus kaupii]|uniref:Uncharacterized protein n=1 Tax=Synaphobranchus kaupii TaxID=118154 RepID=A0A9Q1JG27_SYNKA|nr:hypothetical protein SKAU_G00036980 [Synaphobranchus kaupii]